jgi:hypothetical protein
MYCLAARLGKVDRGVIEHLNGLSLLVFISWSMLNEEIDRKAVEGALLREALTSDLAHCDLNGELKSCSRDYGRCGSSKSI